MAEHSDDQSSRGPRLQEYQQRLEELMASAREGMERQTPEVLEKLAATAKSIAQRLDEMASDARQRAAEKEATPEASVPSPDPAQAPKPPEEPHPDEPRGGGESPPSSG